ncbi:MAG TPA: hypothetical protein VFS57_01835, partial [Gemmatimonadaceae bacterium]|nr:hypothetical protein [Gemmatimonadaceae bacterium]
AGTSLEASAGLAQVFKDTRFGVAAKYVADQAPGARAHRFAADIGVSRDFMRYFTAGVAVQNLGAATSVLCVYARPSDDCPPPGEVIMTASPPETKIDLPLRSTAGVAGSGPLGPLDVTVTAGVSMLRSDRLLPAAGGELAYSWLDGYSVALRAGIRSTMPGEAPATAGVGFTMDRLSLDYAIEAMSGPRAAHRFGLRVR